MSIENLKAAQIDQEAVEFSEHLAIESLEGVHAIREDPYSL